LKDKLLFIPFVIFEKCSIPFKLWILWLLFEKFLCWENGVLQIGIRESWSVRPSRRVLLCWVSVDV